MKLGKKIFLGIMSLLLALILLALCVFFWYYPHYAIHKKELAVQPAGESVTLMSYNLRCLTPLDLGQKSWYYRADLIAADIDEYAPGIIGFQEATRWQYGYFVDVLTGYDSVIEYRDSSVIAEGCPIFYNTELYSLVDKGSFWLSETPEVMSKDWGAAHYRICSYVILTEKTSGKNFVVFNTHLDHVSDEARIKGIGVVLDKIAQFGGMPAVIMGDLNARETSETYKSVTEHFLDAQYVAEDTMQSHTYQNWGNPDSFKRLDYFMVSKSGLTVDRYWVLSGQRNGTYTSDHCSILCTLTLQ
jgi:endonuclease/exonuclease/phosphatase family metal-dependent hydrolase